MTHGIGIVVQVFELQLQKPPATAPAKGRVHLHLDRSLVCVVCSAECGADRQFTKVTRQGKAMQWRHGEQNI